MEKIIYVTEEIAESLTPQTLVTVEKKTAEDPHVPGKSITWLTDKQVEELEEILGYTFINKTLLTQAFTHSSCRPAHNERDAMDNEILEFIGDRSLDLIITKKLISHYGKLLYTEEEAARNVKGFNPLAVEINEGALTRLKTQLVNTIAFSKQADQLKLHEYLITGKSDRYDIIRYNDTTREDLFEALIGAVTIDCKWDMTVLEKVIGKIYNIDNTLADGIEDTNYMGRLQELLKKHDPKSTPIYEIEETDKGFSCTLTVPYSPDFDDDEEGFCFSSSAPTKKLAKMLAAKSACDELFADDDIITEILDTVGEPTPDRAVNQLQELWQKHLIGLPEYSFGHTDAFTDVEWECTCQIDEKETYTVIAANKTTAKKHAAYFALCSILGRYPDGLDFSVNDDTADHTEYQSRISKIEQAIESNIAEAQDIENKIVSLEKEIYYLSNELEDHYMDIQELEESTIIEDPEDESNLKNAIEKHKEKIEVLAQESNKKEAELKTEKALLSDTRSRITRLETFLKEILAQITTVSKELRDELIELILEKENKTKELLYVHHKIHMLNDDLEVAKINIEENGGFYANLKEIVQNLEVQIAQETDTQNGLIIIIDELDGKIKELQERLDTLTAETETSNKAFFSPAQTLEALAAVGEPDLNRAVNQLQELWQKGFIAQPEYTSEETVTDVSSWTFTCRIPEKVEAIGTASTKQAAKKQAAYNAYCALIGR